MQAPQRLIVIALCVVLAITGAAIFLTTELGNRAISGTKAASNSAQLPVELGPFHAAQALARLAATPEEQDLARDALRKADHEVDFAFAAALYRADTQAVPSTPEIKAIQDRIATADQQKASIDADVARLTKLVAGAKENQKEALTEQLDLAKSRQELSGDEIADAKLDLERAGGNPRASVQRQIDDYNASEQSSGGQLDLTVVGKQASTTQPVSNSFLASARALYAVHAMTGGLNQAEQQANASVATFSKQHDELKQQLQQAQAEQLKKLNQAAAAAAAANNSANNSKNNSAPAPSQTGTAIPFVRSLAALQKQLAGLDGRIHNQQDLARVYAQWSALVAARERGLLRSLLISFGWMVVIALAVVVGDHVLERFFGRIESDKRNLLTVRAVLRIATRAFGAILILLIILGPPSQMATVLALAGAGLTVALGDFVSGFVGWFILMGKNGIRHGDWVEINGVSGEVVEIGLFNTVLLETGNWNDAGHPTGRRVTFANSFAIQGHYFNFSTTGQWMWDELQLNLPLDRDPYPLAQEVQKVVSNETEANARIAEQEWQRLGNGRGLHAVSASPAINVRPTGTGFDIQVRYVTRANERYQARAKLYFAIVELFRRKNIPEPAAPATLPSTAAATK